jgi:hypothetical protein
MAKILNEEEMTLSALAEHLEEAGWDSRLVDSHLSLNTPCGLCFTLRLDDDRKFILFNTYFPLRKTFADGSDLVNTLNIDVFLACFALDSEGDVSVAYAMSYERGLILGQFSRLVRRFSGMLEYVLGEYDPDKAVFDFKESATPAPTAVAPRVLQ